MSQKYHKNKRGVAMSILDLKRSVREKGSSQPNAMNFQFRQLENV